MAFFVKKVGIDLGTANTLVFIPGKGIVIQEPTVVAIGVDDNKVLAVGSEAKEMLGRTPETIVAHRPMKDGVIADYRVTEAMLRYFITKAIGNIWFFRPEVLISVPGGITSTEKRAVVDAAQSVGAKAAYVIKETVAAAIGAGIDISTPYGNMVIDIGGGTTDVAVLSLGGIVTSTSVRVAGNKMDAAISEYIRKKHGLAIGERTAEEIKIEIGSALPLEDEMEMEIRGRDLVQGLPKTIRVRTNEVVEAIQEPLREVVQAVRGTSHTSAGSAIVNTVKRDGTWSVRKGKVTVVMGVLKNQKADFAGDEGAIRQVAYNRFIKALGVQEQ